MAAVWLEAREQAAGALVCADLGRRFPAWPAAWLDPLPRDGGTVEGMRSGRAHWGLAAVVFAVAVVAVLQIRKGASMPRAPAGQPALRALDDRAFEQLRDEFNAVAAPKVLVLLSPT